jgi:hypothetical protein
MIPCVHVVTAITLILCLAGIPSHEKSLNISIYRLAEEYFICNFFKLYSLLNFLLNIYIYIFNLPVVTEMLNS